MKATATLFAIFLFVICIPNDLAAQDAREAEIRRLEDMERKAVMNTDSTALFNGLWSPGMVINTPQNVVGNVEGTKAVLRAGNLKYQSFERAIEKITFHDNVAVVMGEERIKPQGKQHNAGKWVTRRFTNVWQYANDKWSIIARQATIIKVE
ncbi:MAG TPA: nuclear transport factor 2 family protein [Daejeonella sp.]|nr:nuclear transport factor 2 family protein [Daejeonella sp.]